MGTLRTLQLALELRLRDWAYQNLRPRSGLPQAPIKPPRGVQESLFYQAVLQEALTPELRGGITHWLDVGCRNWGYLTGCLAALPGLKSGIGIERDPGRIHWNGYYRGDYAQAAALGSRTPERHLEFIAGDFRSFHLAAPGTLRGEAQTESGDGTTLITHFFPFVSENPCRSWGLPPDYSDFTPLAARTVELLQTAAQKNSSPGVWISMHQGEWEAKVARNIWSSLGWTFSEKQILPDSLPGNWPGRHPLHLLTGKVFAPPPC
jgi:hypothetical protein